jgi:acetate kinase
MNIFVINSGSSSLKYQLFKGGGDQPVCSGLVERIGEPESTFTHKYTIDGSQDQISFTESAADHRQAMERVGRLLTQPDIAVIHDASEIDAVGHRVVHGGETLKQTTIITPEVREKIKALFPLAPLHNPGHYKGITVAGQIFPDATQIAVFDTAFHQTLPEKAYRYAIPEPFYRRDGIRVYGFHGISHQYVSDEAMRYLQNPNAKVVTIHLGNGCSMAAVNGGIAIDTSMGFTPLDGLIMGTRCGTIDPSVLTYLMDQKGYDAKQLDELLNKESGMLGLTGYRDMRDIIKQIKEGNSAGALAYEMYAYRIKKFIGAYAAALNGLDALVFTAGVGENDHRIREMVCSDMDFLGITLERSKNESSLSGIRDLTGAGGRCKILVIPTNEELEIARQCRSLLNG